MAMDSQTLYWVLAIVLVLVGLAGTLLPVLPGVGLVFGGLLLAAWIDQFRQVGAVTLVILAVLTALAMLIDILASYFGAKKMGASKLALLGATVGAIAGLAFGLMGVFVGPFVGAVVGELLHQGQLNKAGQAAKVGLGTWLGILIGSLAKLVLALSMVGIFVVAYWL